MKAASPKKQGNDKSPARRAPTDQHESDSLESITGGLRSGPAGNLVASPRTIMALQRQVGNQVVLRLMTSAPGIQGASAASTLQRIPVQRESQDGVITMPSDPTADREDNPEGYDNDFIEGSEVTTDDVSDAATAASVQRITVQREGEGGVVTIEPEPNMEQEDSPKVDAGGFTVLRLMTSESGTGQATPAATLQRMTIQREGQGGVITILPDPSTEQKGNAEAGYDEDVEGFEAAADEESDTVPVQQAAPAQAPPQAPQVLAPPQAPQQAPPPAPTPQPAAEQGPSLGSRVGGTALGLLKGVGLNLLGPFSYFATGAAKKKAFRDAEAEREKLGAGKFATVAAFADRLGMMFNEVAFVLNWCALVCGLIGIGVPVFAAIAPILGAIGLGLTVAVGVCQIVGLAHDIYALVTSVSGSDEAKAAWAQLKKDLIGAANTAIAIIGGGIGAAGGAGVGGENSGFGSEIGKSFNPEWKMATTGAAETLVKGTLAVGGGAAPDILTGAASGHGAVLEDFQAQTLLAPGALPVMRQPAADPQTAEAIDLLGQISTAGRAAKADQEQEKVEIAQKDSSLAAGASKLSAVSGKFAEADAAAPAAKAREAEAGVDKADSEAAAFTGGEVSREKLAQAEELNTKLDQAESQSGQSFGERPADGEKPKPGFFSRVKAKVKKWWGKAKAWAGKVFARFGRAVAKVKMKIVEIVMKVTGNQDKWNEMKAAINEGQAGLAPARRQLTEANRDSTAAAAAGEQVAAAADKAKTGLKV